MSRYLTCHQCGDEIAVYAMGATLRPCAECGAELCDRCVVSCGCQCGLKVCRACGVPYGNEIWLRPCLEDRRTNLVEMSLDALGDIRAVDAALGSAPAAHFAAPHQHRCHGSRRGRVAA
jgi:NMD protein affecting ribosome stability and mRNA decay